MAMISLLLLLSGLTTQEYAKASGPTPELGCRARVTKHIAPLVETHSYRETLGITQHKVVIRAVIQTMYAMCHGKRTKVKPKWHELCYTLIESPNHLNFTGVTLQETIWSPENGHSLTPDAVKVKDHGVQGCVHKDIPLEEEHWFFERKRNGVPNARHKMTRFTVNLIWDIDPGFSDVTRARIFDPILDWKVG
jgi:hypothetical protein